MKKGEFPFMLLGLRQGVRAMDRRLSPYHLPLHNDHGPGIYTRSSIAWVAMVQGHGIPKCGTE